MRKLLVTLLATIVGYGAAAPLKLQPVENKQYEAHDEYFSYGINMFPGGIGDRFLTIGSYSKDTPNLMYCSQLYNLGIQGGTAVIKFEKYTAKIDSFAALSKNFKPVELIAAIMTSCVNLNLSKLESSDVVYLPKDATFQLPSPFDDYTGTLSLDSRYRMSVKLNR